MLYDFRKRKPRTPLILTLHERLEATWAHSFVAVAPERVSARSALNLVMNVFRGMAVQAVLRRDEGYFIDMLQALKAILAVHVKPVSQEG